MPMVSKEQVLEGDNSVVASANQVLEILSWFIVDSNSNQSFLLLLFLFDSPRLLTLFASSMFSFPQKVLFPVIFTVLLRAIDLALGTPTLLTPCVLVSCAFEFLIEDILGFTISIDRLSPFSIFTKFLTVLNFSENRPWSVLRRWFYFWHKFHRSLWKSSRFIFPFTSKFSCFYKRMF